MPYSKVNITSSCFCCRLSPTQLIDFPPFKKYILKRPQAFWLRWGPRHTLASLEAPWVFHGTPSSSGKRKGQGSSFQAMSCRSPSPDTDVQINFWAPSPNDATWKRAQPLPPVTPADKHHLSGYILLLHLLFLPPAISLISLSLLRPIHSSESFPLVPWEDGLG